MTHMRLTSWDVVFETESDFKLLFSFGVLIYNILINNAWAHEENKTQLHCRGLETGPVPILRFLLTNYPSETLPKNLLN